MAAKMSVLFAEEPEKSASRSLTPPRARPKLPKILQLSKRSKISRDAMNRAWRYLGGAAALRATKPIDDGARMRDVRDRLWKAYIRRLKKRDAKPKDEMEGAWESVGELEISPRAQETMEEVKRDKLATSIPTRIYDTRSDELRLPVRFERYIAVSYVWTQYSSIKDIVEDMRHIIEATQIDSLWIDRVCIDQEDAQDKAREIPRMDEYYSGANLVVALVPEVRVHDGIISLPRKVVMKESGRDMIDLYDDLNSSKWMHRVWTFQEAALARRLLLVTETATIDDADYSLVSAAHEHLESGSCKVDDIEWTPWRRHDPAYCYGYDCGGGAILSPASKLRLPNSKWTLADLPELWNKSGPRGCFHPEDQVYGYLGLLNLPPDVPVVYGVGFENLMQGIFRHATQLSLKILISHPSQVEGCCWLPSISNESHILHVGDAQREVEAPRGRVTSTGMMRIRATLGFVEVGMEWGGPFVNYCALGTRDEWNRGIELDQRQILVTNCGTKTMDDLYGYDALFVNCKYRNKGVTMIIWGEAKKKGVFHREGTCVISGTVEHADEPWKVGAGVLRSANEPGVKLTNSS